MLLAMQAAQEYTPVKYFIIISNILLKVYKKQGLHERAIHASVDTLASFAGLSASQNCLLRSLLKPGLWNKVFPSLPASQAANAPVPDRLARQ